MLLNFERTIAAFADATVRQRRSGFESAQGEAEAVTRFLIAVHGRLPDYLRTPFHILTLVFDAWSIPLAGRPFHKLDLARRAAQIKAWEGSRLEVRRRLMEFYGSLALFGLYSELYGQDYQYE